MGLLTKLLKPALKRLSKRGNKTLAKQIYKYRRPAAIGGAANAPFIDTPNSMDDDSFNRYLDLLKSEGLVADEEGLGNGVIDIDDAQRYWREKSYGRNNPWKSWGSTLLTEGSSFIPFAGIPLSMMLSDSAEKGVDEENYRLYQDIRRQAYAGMNKPFVEDFKPEPEEE